MGGEDSEVGGEGDSALCLRLGIVVLDCITVSHNADIVLITRERLSSFNNL